MNLYSKTQNPISLKIAYCMLAIANLLFVNSCNSQTNPTNGKTTAIFNTSKTYETMTDQDGNVYKTITIGNQTWMAENLRTTKYRNGDLIPEVIDNLDWDAINIGACCTYKNTKSCDTIATYGRYYNWFAVSDSRNIAPLGWHVPTDAECQILANYLSGEGTAGGKMKENSTSHWQSPNQGATNESGFTAIPSGDRVSYDGTFMEFGFSSYFWTSTSFDAYNSWYRYMDCTYSAFTHMADVALQFGLTIRLVKD